TRTRTETEIPSRRQGGRITRAAAFVVARFFLTFPEKTSKRPYKIEKSAEICGDFPLFIHIVS
ncbi:MAG: hypothetical protein IIX13_09280, partial [Bacteroidales bacterium]|nr:hypothetical protein [Bacteroidales bacterium]